MSMRLPAATHRRALELAGVPPAARRVRGMNRTESAWAAALTADPAVDAWLYESVTLKLGPDVRYTADFLVVGTDGRLGLDEVKGRQREDAMIKLRVAAGMFPWLRFRLVRHVKGQWIVKEIRP